MADPGITRVEPSDFCYCSDSYDATVYLTAPVTAEVKNVVTNNFNDKSRSSDIQLGPK
jgi:hypothetical protein